MFHVKDLCPDVITVPIGVEATWALITPRNKQTGSKIKNIALASVYFSSTQTRKSDFLDHIAQSYNLLCAKYGSDLKFIIAGDLNKLKIGLQIYIKWSKFQQEDILMQSLIK
jgi:hypothetical protein